MNQLSRSDWRSKPNLIELERRPSGLEDSSKVHFISLEHATHILVGKRYHMVLREYARILHTLVVLKRCELQRSGPSLGTCTHRSSATVQPGTGMGPGTSMPEKGIGMSGS